MEIKSEFSKMQCLFTGNRFSGVNIEKTRIETDYLKDGTNQISLRVIFKSDISYLEVEDEVKYQQYATIVLKESEFAKKPFLLQIINQLRQELTKRWVNSNIFKFLELKSPDEFTDVMLNELVDRILSDYRKGKR